MHHISALKHPGKKIGIYLFAFFIMPSLALAQAGAGNKLGDQHEHYVDSIKNSDYIWKFPIWGKKASKKGFDLPYPVGIMLNPYIGSQKMLITDLQVGINGSKLVPLDFIKFGEVKANVQSISIRPDLWLFPFMDLYLIGGISYAQTNVNVAEPFNFSTRATFNGYTYGVGSTFAGGYHSIITIIDLNHTWTHMSDIKGTISATMFTPRLGMNFIFRKSHVKTIAVWVGAQGMFVNRTTEGTIDLNSLHSTSTSKADLESIVNEQANWYQQLSPGQKVVIKKIAEAILNKINGNADKDATISYSLVKQPESKWSMCVGGQYQFSHRWQVRTEVGFLGGRKSLLLSGNYRFRW